MYRLGTVIVGGRSGVGRHGAGGADAGGAGGGGDLRRRRGDDGGGVARVSAVQVLLQVEPGQLPDDHLLLQLQLRPRRQVQPRAGQVRLHRVHGGAGAN